MTAADLIAAMQGHLADLASRKARLEGRLNGLSLELDHVEREIRDTEVAIAAAQRFTEGLPDTEPRGVAGLSIADACEAIIRELGGSATVSTMVERLEETGKVRGGDRRRNYNTVSSQLYRNSARFERVPNTRGTWRLRAAPLTEPPLILSQIQRADLLRAVAGLPPAQVESLWVQGAKAE